MSGTRKAGSSRRGLLKTRRRSRGSRAIRAALVHRCGCSERRRRACGLAARPSDPPRTRHRAHARSRARRFRIRRCLDRRRQDQRHRPKHRLAARYGRCRLRQPDHHSGFRGHACPFLSRPAQKHASERPRRSRLQSRHPEQSDARLFAVRRSYRRTDHRARHDRHGHDHDRGHRADQPFARAQRCVYSRLAGVRHSRRPRLFPWRGSQRALSAGYRAASAHLFQFARSAAHARDGGQHGSLRRSARHAMPAFLPSCISASSSEPFLRLGRAGTLSRRRFVHPCDAHERRRLAPHQGHWRARLAVAAARDGDGSWLPCDAGRARPRVRPSLSSDHSATVAQDMFGVMRSAFAFQRLNILQRRMRNEQNVPPLL